MRFLPSMMLLFLGCAQPVTPSLTMELYYREGEAEAFAALYIHRPYLNSELERVDVRVNGVSIPRGPGGDAGHWEPDYTGRLPAAPNRSYGLEIVSPTSVTQRELTLPSLQISEPVLDGVAFGSRHELRWSPALDKAPYDVSLRNGEFCVTMGKDVQVSTSSANFVVQPADVVPKPEMVSPCSREVFFQLSGRSGELDGWNLFTAGRTASFVP